MREDRPDLVRQFRTGWTLVRTGRVFDSWVTGTFLVWWIVVTLGDAITTSIHLQSGSGEEANPVAATLFAAVGPYPTMIAGSLICLALAIFTVGEHRREDTYYLLTVPTLILVVKTIATANNTYLLF